MSNDEIPLFARVTVDGKRAEISLKKRVDPLKWNAKTSYLDGTGEEIKEQRRKKLHFSRGNSF